MRAFLLSALTILLFSTCKKNDVATPKSDVPGVKTNPITDLTNFSVTFSGKVVDSFGVKLLEQGFLLDTLGNPLLYKNLAKFQRPVDANGAFSMNLIDLLPGKTYYLKAYATSEKGIGYGNEITFKSLPEKLFNGNVALSSQQEVNNFGLNNYTRINGSLSITGPVNDLSPLKALAIINFGIEVKNTQLINFKGLENLEIIGSDFFDFCKIENNPLLKNFSGLTHLRIINGMLYIVNNDALENLVGLDNFTLFANGDFRIQGCDQIRSVQGLEKMQTVLGSITLFDNALLSDLSAWNNLDSVSGSIYIGYNPSLQEINGFRRLKRLAGLTISANPVLRSLGGFSSLNTVSEILHIDANESLANLSGLENITTTEYLNIINNKALLNFEGLTNLQSVTARFKIENNPALVNFRGLQRLKRLRNLEVNSNNELSSFVGLDSLSTFSGSVYSLSAAYNNRLMSLDGLNQLRSVEGSIYFTGNASLANFCALKPLFTAGYNGPFGTENNLSNPNKARVLSDCP